MAQTCTHFGFIQPVSPRLKVVSIACVPVGAIGSISAFACRAGTSAVVRIHPDATPRSTFTPRAIRSSAPSSRMKTGSGATWTKPSWSHDRTAQASHSEIPCMACRVIQS